MTDPIDYSRPVGWWCTYCEEDQPCTCAKLSIPMACKHIPRYLPLPTPEPVEVDEVETGEAEVVTCVVGGLVCYSAGGWVTFTPTADEINYMLLGHT
jgi:hypothetical protein